MIAGERSIFITAPLATSSIYVRKILLLSSRIAMTVPGPSAAGESVEGPPQSLASNQPLSLAIVRNCPLAPIDAQWRPIDVLPVKPPVDCSILPQRLFGSSWGGGDIRSLLLPQRHSKMGCHQPIWRPSAWPLHRDL